jgi:glycosyltransferase involved in cell wall biosynthesis
LRFYLFEKYNLGILLSDFSEQQFAQAIHQLPHLPEIPPKQLREAAEEYFSLEKGIEKYLEVYQHLLN